MGKGVGGLIIRTWSLSTNTALTPSVKSFRSEDLKAIRYSIFIIPLSCTGNGAINYNYIKKNNWHSKKINNSCYITFDNWCSSFPCAAATSEKCFLVKQREKGAPFPSAWRASCAHSETATHAKPMNIRTAREMVTAKKKS